MASRNKSRAGGRKGVRVRPTAPHRQSRKRPQRKQMGILARLGQALARRVALRRPRLMLVLASLVLFLVAAYYVTGTARRVNLGASARWTALENSAGFAISKPVVSGENRTPEKLILDVLNLQPGQSIFSADLSAARARLLTLPWVADARVTRRYPGTLTVAIVEKQPFALWQSGKTLYVIDKTGAPIVPAALKDFPELPVFVGDPPQGGEGLVAAIRTHRAVSARLAAMQRISGRRWNLILNNGVVVKLPETGWPRQLDVLERLIVEKGILERDIREIDLREPDRMLFGLTGQKSSQPAPQGSRI